MPDYKALAAEKWFGYGRWSATYWFVGMEPGGDEDPRVYESWHELGEPDLLDLYEHSVRSGDMRWFTNGPPLQRTWTQLIRIVLGYENAPTDTEDVRRYQRDRLGRTNDDTLLIELSSVNAKNLSVPVPERERHREDRIATIRQHLDDPDKPDFVVFYGLRYRDEYAKIAGDAFDVDGFAWRGPILCMLVQHPVARPTMPADWWIEKGRTLRSRRSSRQTAG